MAECWQGFVWNGKSSYEAPSRYAAPNPDTTAISCMSETCVAEIRTGPPSNQQNTLRIVQAPAN